MTLSGTRCGGLEIRFMGAARPSIHVQTKTTLESCCCPDLFESEAHTRTMSQECGRQNPDTRRHRTPIQLRHNSALLDLTRFLDANRSPPPDQVRGHTSLENALAACKRTPPASRLPAGLSRRTGMAALYVFGKFSSTPTPSGS